MEEQQVPDLSNRPGGIQAIDKTDVHRICSGQVQRHDLI